MNTNGFSIADLNQMIREIGGTILEAYEHEYTRLRTAHPVYHLGWGVPITHPHRFMNFVVAAAYAAECSGTWVDVGVYDGALVMLLRRMGVDAFGVDGAVWHEMWKLLFVDDLMNVPTTAPDVVSVLNFAHAFEPREFVRKIDEQYDTPALLLIDREMRTPSENNALWYDEAVLTELGFTEIIAFPDLAKDNIDYGRELLVRRR